jgi:hypothetical protein
MVRAYSREITACVLAVAVYSFEKNCLDICSYVACLVEKIFAWIWIENLLGYGLKILPTSVSDVRRLKKLRVWFGSHLFD